MTKINLRDYYSFYDSDLFVEIPDEVETAFFESERLEKNYIRRGIYNKAPLSLTLAMELKKLLFSFSSLLARNLINAKVLAKRNKVK